jgi:hypothetical protein
LESDLDSNEQQGFVVGHRFRNNNGGSARSCTCSAPYFVRQIQQDTVSSFTPVAFAA